MTGRERPFDPPLVCPVHASTLEVPAEMQGRGVPWPDGELVCPAGCRYPVVGGVPRFLGNSTYASAFGLQWRRYQRTQLDSWTKVPVSRQRLERVLGMPLSGLAGLSVLECGSGAGRFTEYLLEHAGALLSLDLTDAVEANLANCGGKKAFRLVQADLRHAPVPPQSFDLVICLGVVQHTPSPEDTLGALCRYVKPGGVLVVDHYRRGPLWIRVGRAVSVPALLRHVVMRLPAETGLRVTRGIHAVCDPVRKVASRWPALDLVASFLIPSASYYGRIPGLRDETIRAWNELDTHDGLTDWYKHRRSPREIEACLRSLGMEVEHCAPGGNGVEARARRPAGEA